MRCVVLAVEQVRDTAHDDHVDGEGRGDGDEFLLEICVHGCSVVSGWSISVLVTW
jgi:hypothetical protein